MSTSQILAPDSKTHLGNKQTAHLAAYRSRILCVHRHSAFKGTSGARSQAAATMLLNRGLTAADMQHARLVL